MSKIIKALVALMLGAVMVVPMAQAVSGDKGFYYGTEAEQRDLNKVLARLVRASLAKDPSGNARLSESNCGEKGGCGTPRLLMDSFRQMKGLPPIDLANLAEFLESLEADENRGGYYDVTSLRPDTKAPGGFRAVMDGVQRGFNLGEKAWSYHDKKNNRKIVVLMSNCANPVFRIVHIEIIGGQEPCAEIRFFARTRDKVVRLVPMNLPSFEDECPAIRKVGETTWIPWQNACPSGDCSFTSSEQYLGIRAWDKLASFELTPGEYVVRVPRRFADENSPYLVAFCLDRAWPERPQKPTKAIAEAWNIRQSDSVYVRWNAYRPNADGVSVATIWYSEAEVPATETVKMYWRFGVWNQEQSLQR